MKEKLYVAFTTLAIVVMMIATLMPHHHHRHGMICTAVEYCEDDGKYNDEHTGHSGDNTKCIEKSAFINSKVGGTGENDLSASLLPLFILVSNYILNSDIYQEDSGIKSLYRQSLYKSADVCNVNSLRGPPCLFV